MAEKITQAQIETLDTYNQEVLPIITIESNIDDFQYWLSIPKLKIWKNTNNTSTTNKYCICNCSTTVIPWWMARTTITISSYTSNDTWMETWSNKVTITSKWVYVISASWYWSFWWWWDQRTTIIEVNWNPLSWEKRIPDNTWTNTSISYVWVLNVWDYIEYRWEQNDTSSLDFTPAHFWIAQIQVL